jgi:hypothetical protein
MNPGAGSTAWHFRLESEPESEIPVLRKISCTNMPKISFEENLVQGPITALRKNPAVVLGDSSYLRVTR